MNLGELVTLPIRLAVGLTRTTLALGHLASSDGPIFRDGGADRIAHVFSRGGLIDQASVLLLNERGVVALSNTVADLTAPDRPLGQALQPGGVIDRLAAEDGPFMQLLAEDGPVARMIVDDGPVQRMLAEDGPVMLLLAEDGPVMRLLAQDGPVMRLLGEEGPVTRLLSEGGPVMRLLGDDGALYRFLEANGPLDRLLGKQGAVDHLLEPGGLIDQLLEEDGILEKLLQPGGTVDQVVGLALTLRGLIPIMDELHEAVQTLNTTVEPVSRVANRVPLGRKRALSQQGQVPGPVAGRVVVQPGHATVVDEDPSR
jgi:hypothetical protein